MKKKILFTGLDPASYSLDKPVLHVPFIEIIPRPIHCSEIVKMYEHLDHFTHIIFTSKNAVRIFFDYFWKLNKNFSLLKQLIIISIGEGTSNEIKRNHLTPHYTAELMQQEGIIEILHKLDLSKAHLLLPRSSLARLNLSHFLVEKGIRHYTCNLYDTVYLKPKTEISFEEIAEVVFTSPSTVNAFFTFYKEPPKNVSFRCIGEITRKQLIRYINKN